MFWSEEAENTASLVLEIRGKKLRLLFNTASGNDVRVVFVKLKSIALSGIGQYVLISSSIGGFREARKVKYICDEIDKVDMEEVTAKVRSVLSQVGFIEPEPPKRLQTKWETAKDIWETIIANVVEEAEYLASEAKKSIQVGNHERIMIDS